MAAVTGMDRKTLAQRVEELNRDTSRLAREDLEGRAVRPLARCLRESWRHLQEARRIERRLPGAWDSWCEAVFQVITPWLIYAKCWEERLRIKPSAAGRPPEGFSDAVHGPGSRDRLTAILLTKNEEKRIERCLKSLAWADQIVVVDDESTDRTPELCRRAGATVITHALSDNFSEQRNVGLEAASGEWILRVDADEVVTPELARAIGRVLKKRDRRHPAFHARRRNILLGHFMRHGGWYYDHLCLVRRTGVRYQGRVHEFLKLQGPIGHLRADLVHEPFQSFEQFLRRQNYYTDLEVRDLVDGRGTALSWQAVRREVVVKPLKSWWKSYARRGGYRDGLHGLIFSVLSAWVEWLLYAKYWEAICLRRPPE